MTIEDINTVVSDVLTGRPDRIQTPEADELRLEVQNDIALAKLNGWDVVIPSEWEVDDAD